MKVYAMQFVIVLPVIIAMVLVLSANGADAMGGCGHKVTADKSPYAILEPQTVVSSAAPGSNEMTEAAARPPRAIRR
jgi:hypothetical protein